MGGAVLTHVWNLPGPAFTTAFLWSSIGILVGALSAGPIGDRVGRKPLLLASVTIFGIASLLSAFAPSLIVLTVLRFFTGLGIGGAFPGAATLAGDYAPHRLRATMIMATFTGAPIGGFVGGQIVALLLPYFGWPVIFVLGGVFPLVLVPVLVLWLPESPRFLARKPNLSPRQAALLARLDIAAGQRELHAVDVAHENPIKMLFGKGFALQTDPALGDLLLQPDEPVPVRLLAARGLASDRHDAGRARCSPRASAISARSSRFSTSAC